MKFYFFLIVFSIVFYPVYDVSADVLQYEKAVSQAMKHSRKLMEAELDREIKVAVVNESRYLRYPELSLKIYSEQTNDLSDEGKLASIGGTVLSDTSMYQNTAYIDFNYNLLDYGVRRRQVSIARMDVDAAQAMVRKTKMDMEKEILDIYSNVLKTSLELNYRNALLGLSEQLDRIRKKMGDTGIINRFTIMDREIELERTKSDIETLKYKLSVYLDDLSLYTGDTYDPKSLEVARFSFKLKDPGLIDFRKLPDYEYYVRQYQMKNEELEIEKKKFYPNIDLYMRYSFYGSDVKDYYRSLDVSQKNFTTGITTTIPLMENFKRRHTLSRLRSERLKAETMMEEKYDELKVLFEKMKKNYAYYQIDVMNKEKLLALVKEKSGMMTRLTESRVIDLEQGLEQKMTLISQELELEKQIVDGMSAVKSIMIQTEGAM